MDIPTFSILIDPNNGIPTQQLLIQKNAGILDVLIIQCLHPGYRSSDIGRAGRQAVSATQQLWASLKQEMKHLRLSSLLCP
jgi:hypothetical protein